MTAPVLADALGPRGRRRSLIASIVSTVVIALLVLVALKRFSDKGQFEGSKWKPFTNWPTLKFLLGGMGNTIKAAIVAMVLAGALGALLALGRLARNVVTRNLAGVYVELFRGVPLLLLMFFSAHGLPRLHVRLALFWYVVLALVAYNGAVLGEIFRAGILSLDPGQQEAASAIGLGYWQGMFSVIIPQAMRRMIPAIVSQLVTLLKDTSLGFVVTYEEFLRRGEIAGEFGKNLLQTYIFVAAAYMVVNIALSQTARRLEVRQRSRYSAGAIRVRGIEDLAVVNAHGEGGVPPTG
jgi:glutamate transport system permease protein